MLLIVLMTSSNVNEITNHSTMLRTYLLSKLKLVCSNDSNMMHMTQHTCPIIFNTGNQTKHYMDSAAVHSCQHVFSPTWRLTDLHAIGEQAQ